MIRMVLVSLVLIWARTSSADTVRNLGKLIDSRDTLPVVVPGPGGSLYAYAPSIIYLNGKFHMFYCSTNTEASPNGQPPRWDAVRYSWSNDGRQWSTPRIRPRNFQSLNWALVFNRLGTIRHLLSN